MSLSHPTAPNFWNQVSRHVGSRTAEECSSKYQSTQPTRFFFLKSIFQWI